MLKILSPSDLRLATYSQFQTLARNTVRDPVFLLLLSIAWISVQFGFTAVPFQQHSLLVNQIVLGGFLLLYLCAKYYWLAAWFYRGTALGVPLFVIYLSFYTTAHIFFHLVFGPLVFDDDFARSWERFWRTYAIAVPLTVAYAFSFLPRATSMINADSTAQARPAAQTPEPQTPAPPAAYIEGVPGRVLQIHVEDKHSVIVTDQGQRIVRKTLSELVADFDESLGFRCHRSLWIAKDQFTDLVYINGNPHVVLTDDKVHSVSRSIVAKLRDHLDELQHNTTIHV